MKVLHEKSKSDKTSSMRLAFMLVVMSACIVSIGASVGFIIAVILNRELVAIGAALGGFAGIIGSLLLPAFGGKSLQRFAENNKDGGNECGKD